MVLNLVLKPAVDALVNDELAQLATLHDDEFLALMLAEFQQDTVRSQNWTTELVKYALAADPALADVVRSWIDDHEALVDAAVAGLAELFPTDAQAISAQQVIDAAASARARLRESCGL